MHGSEENPFQNPDSSRILHQFLDSLPMFIPLSLYTSYPQGGPLPGISKDMTPLVEVITPVTHL